MQGFKIRCLKLKPVVGRWPRADIWDLCPKISANRCLEILNRNRATQVRLQPNKELHGFAPVYVRCGICDAHETQREGDT